VNLARAFKPGWPALNLSRRVATIEKLPDSWFQRVATRRAIVWDAFPALKGRAKLITTRRVVLVKKAPLLSQRELQIQNRSNLDYAPLQGDGHSVRPIVSSKL
jgi:hypothetical protein